MLAPLILMLANPAAAGELRQPLLQLLNAYESGATQAELRALGDGVPAELMEIAADSAIPHSRRGRAVSALASYPTPVVRRFLEGQLSAKDLFLRRKASVALIHGFQDAALPTVQPALDDPDVQLRLATVRALHSLGSDKALALLDARRQVETDPTVKSALTEALR